MRKSEWFHSDKLGNRKEQCTQKKANERQSLNRRPNGQPTSAQPLVWTTMRHVYKTALLRQLGSRVAQGENYPLEFTEVKECLCVTRNKDKLLSLSTKINLKKEKWKPCIPLDFTEPPLDAFVNSGDYIVVIVESYVRKRKQIYAEWFQMQNDWNMSEQSTSRALWETGWELNVSLGWRTLRARFFNYASWKRVLPCLT